MVRIIGSNFLPSNGTERELRIRIGSEVVARGVVVNASGNFSVVIPVQSSIGEMVVTAEQTDGRRLTAERASIDVIPRESEGNARAARSKN
jgi:hypothetical protein